MSICNRTLSRTVRHARSTGLWKTMPMLSGGPSTLLPAIVISPAVAGSSPPVIFKSVDFPQPDGPTIAMNSPSRMSSDSGLSDSTGPSAVWYVLATPSMQISGRDNARASGEIVVRVIVLGLARCCFVETAVFDQQRHRFSHVLCADAEGAIVRIVGAFVQRGRVLHSNERGGLDARFRLRLQHRVDGRFRILRSFFERARRRAHEALDEI